MMSLIEILESEKELLFTEFNENTAWNLGVFAAEYVLNQKLPVAIRIERDSQILFQSSFTGTTVDNDLWLRGKINVVKHFRHSSYYISRTLIESGKSMEEKYILDSSLYRAKGGAVPLFLKNSCIAAVFAISGLRDDEDHKLCHRIVRDFLKNEFASPSGNKTIV